MRTSFVVRMASVVVLACGGMSGVVAAERGLIGHWKLEGDCRDASRQGNHGTARHVKFDGREGAEFDGLRSRVEVPDSPSLEFAQKPFSIAVWAKTESALDDIPGDLLSKYDLASRTGVNLAIQSHAGATSSQANWGNLSFGIDAARIDCEWSDCGRLGEADSVYALAVFRGRLYATTLYWPAKVYRYVGSGAWSYTGQLDTGEGLYRRAWSLAVHNGKLFAGTMPSGRVWSLEVGRCVTCDHALAPNWRHIVAVKDADRLRLYVDGKCAGVSSTFEPSHYQLSNRAPLRIGLGPQDHFKGRLRDVRIYDRPLGPDEIQGLLKQR